MPVSPTYIADDLKHASFAPRDLQRWLAGGEAPLQLAEKWDRLFDGPLYDQSNDTFKTREEKMLLHAKRSFEAVRIMKKNKDLLAAHSPVHGPGGASVKRLTGVHSGLTDHFALFVSTILAQGEPQQVRQWIPKALNLEILGTYAQTELGHGSNIRALETTATFDPATDEIILNMPSITAMKWWPGSLGILATHAIVYARLIVGDTDHGFNAFIVQVRDHEHKAMPNVEVGDIGPKMGHHGLDSGYLNLRNVRIPRTNMLMKFQKLGKDGVYTRAPKHLGKIAYVTMMKARVLIAMGAAGHLGEGLTVAVRYNVLRRQGFIDAKQGIAGGERQIIDYTMQRMRLFPAIATAYAIIFSVRRLQGILKTFDGAVKAAGKDIAKIDTSMIPELHATSAGLKAFSTEMAAWGVEEARKCCGGHGYHMSSGIAGSVVDYMAAVTYEGDRLPMALQTARALVGVVGGKVQPTGTFAYLVEETAAPTAKQAVANPAALVELWQCVARNSVRFAGQQLMEAAAKGKKGNDAWLAAHVPLVACAFAHSVSVMISSFAAAISGAPDATRPALTRLCVLFGLTRLAEVNVAHTRLSSDDARVVDAGVKQLLQDIRPDALALCEAFGYSDRHLNSCIARSDGKVYEALFDYAKRSPLNTPEYVQRIHRDELASFLDADYLAKGARAAKL